MRRTSSHRPWKQRLGIDAPEGWDTATIDFELDDTGIIGSPQASASTQTVLIIRFVFPIPDLGMIRRCRDPFSR